MSIVTMKRLRLIALQSDREAIFNGLQRLGCVQVDESTPEPGDPLFETLRRPDASALSAARERLELGGQALELLKRYSGEKSGGLTPRPEVSTGQFFDDEAYARTEETARQLRALQQELTALTAEQAKLQNQRAALQPWLELDVPLDTASTQAVSALFGSIPAAGSLDELAEALGQAGQLCALTPAGKDADLQYLFLLCHKSVEGEVMEVLQRWGFTRTVFRDLTGTAGDNDLRLQKALKENDAKAQALTEQIAGAGDQAQALKLFTDRARQEVRREEAKSRLWDTGESFFLSGWFPAEDEGRVKALLDGFPYAWEVSDPTEEEYPQVPVKLKNGKLTSPMSMVTEMYSLPAYGSVDPNPLMAPFFILFYGMMMADMGYGIVMMLVSILSIKLLKPKGPTVRHMMPLLGLCGVSTFIWGALTGGFFGDLLPQMAMLIDPNTTFTQMPALFSPLDDAVPVLIGSLILGVCQIFVGMAVSMYRKIKQGEVMAALCGEGAWYLVFVLAGVAAAGVIPVNTALIAILILLVLTQGYGKKGLVGKLVGIGGSLYNNITGYFSDILSYSRLMALMLAGAVVAQVFNQLGAMTGNVVAFFIIAMIGNALNFALNVLGCYVHDMRLQCLEFFGRFYEDGGRAFQPLDISTQYVDIVNQ